jgi:endonuclease/exonuclease/phosphatase family metal-dependent hydrolase
MRNRFGLRLDFLYTLEAGLAGFLFIGVIRFLIGSLYSRLGSASITLNLTPELIPANTPGVFPLNTLTNELSFLVYMVALPLLTIFLGRFRWISMIALLLVGAGRILMISVTPISPLIGAAMTFGGGLVYMAMLVRFRAQHLPYFFVLGITADQLMRALGNTLDPTWSATRLGIDAFGFPLALDTQLLVIGSAVLVLALALIILIGESRRQVQEESSLNRNDGLMPFWGAVGLGGLLFLQLAFLGLPNALTGRAGVDYTLFSPFITVATVLPIVPFIRQRAASVIGIFDSGLRGWLWMLIITLLIIVGTRFQGLLAGVALIIGQFITSLLWWWLVRPRAEKERVLVGLWLILSVFIFALLTVVDNFTYEYGYVQNMAPDFAFLDPYIPPFLRAFRGLGMAVILLAVFLAVLPMVKTQRRIPWALESTSVSTTLLTILFVIAMAAGVAAAVRPIEISPVRDIPQNPVDRIRIGTYNIHGGFSEFFHFDIVAIARTIAQSGADVVLLQQVETGRMTSFGVDQALWLARNLRMDVRFFPTNEGLQGLAVLSRVPIVNSTGMLLTSRGQQSGMQHVTIQPDEGTITLYNTRLEYLLDVGDGRSLEEQEQDQQQQLNEIFAYIAANNPNRDLGRTILGGTFNNIPDSPLGDQMRTAGFVDPFAGQPTEIAATFWRTGYPRVQFDYLWIWRGQQVLLTIGANTIDSSTSDHRMAVIETLFDVAASQ